MCQLSLVFLVVEYWTDSCSSGFSKGGKRDNMEALVGFRFFASESCFEREISWKSL